jgi:hypothetical protein
MAWRGHRARRRRFRPWHFPLVKISVDLLSQQSMAALLTELSS